VGDCQASNGDLDWLSVCLTSGTQFLQNETGVRRLPSRTKQKSKYEAYPLPFPDRKKHSTWDVTPTGNSSADCETGEAYAIEFLKSCDKTNGWVADASNRLGHDQRRPGCGDQMAVREATVSSLASWE